MLAIAITGNRTSSPKRANCKAPPLSVGLDGALPEPGLGIMPDPSSTLIISTLDGGSCVASLKHGVAKTIKTIEKMVEIEKNLKVRYISGFCFC